VRALEPAAAVPTLTRPPPARRDPRGPPEETIWQNHMRRVDGADDPRYDVDEDERIDRADLDAVLAAAR
jgi:hypothetical protein